VANDGDTHGDTKRDYKLSDFLATGMLAQVEWVATEPEKKQRDAECRNRGSGADLCDTRTAHAPNEKEIRHRWRERAQFAMEVLKSCKATHRSGQRLAASSG
jgi:hypothetical protein